VPAPAGCDRHGHIRRIDVLAQTGGKLVATEFASPRHHGRRDTIAGEIHQRPAFTHEFVDAEKARHPGRVPETDAATFLASLVNTYGASRCSMCFAILAANLNKHARIRGVSQPRS
jgi:hypothetical protein